MRVAPGVIQVDGGRPMDSVQVLRHRAVVGRVLGVAGEGFLRPRLADQQKCENQSRG